jgi:hypothetical protein
LPQKLGEWLFSARRREVRFAQELEVPRVTLRKILEKQDAGAGEGDAELAEGRGRPAGGKKL